MKHSVGGLISFMFAHPMLSSKCRMADCYAFYTTVYYTLLHHFLCYTPEEFIYILHRSLVKGQHRQYPHIYHIHMPVFPRHHQINRRFHQNCLQCHR
jgi:hypothetical protein